MHQSYEMMYILRPDLLEEQVQQEVNKYRDLLREYQAEDIEVKIWGKRRLAYPIQKFQDGIYVLVNYRCDGKQVAPVERAMRLSDEVIRYLTLKVDEKPTDSPAEEPAELSDAAA